MAADTKRLVRDWIRFLKGLRAVKMQSDPTTGELSYNRKITSDDIFRFLEVNTQFSEDEITNAINSVLSKTKPSTDISTHMHQGTSASSGERKIKDIAHTPDKASSQAAKNVQTNQQPGHPKTQQKQLGAPTASKSKYDNSGVSDIDYKDIPGNRRPPSQPGQERNPRFKYRPKGSIKEAIRDLPGTEVSENDVEDIFNILASGTGNAESKPNDNQQNDNQQNDNDSEEKKQSDLNKIKRVIRDNMNDEQRKALWRALND